MGLSFSFQCITVPHIVICLCLTLFIFLVDFIACYLKYSSTAGLGNRLMNLPCDVSSCLGAGGDGTEVHPGAVPGDRASYQHNRTYGSIICYTSTVFINTSNCLWRKQIYKKCFPVFWQHLIEKKGGGDNHDHCIQFPEYKVDLLKLTLF